MMTLEEVRSALSDRNLRKVAAGAGLSEASVYRAVKPGSSPSYDTFKALSDYLEGQSGVNKGDK